MFELLCNAAKEYDTDIVMCDVIHSYPDQNIRSQQMIEPGLYDKKGYDKKRSIPSCCIQGNFINLVCIQQFGIKYLRRSY